MKSVTSRAMFLATIMGFSLSAIVAAGNVNAKEEKTILDQAIHDYSDDAYAGDAIPTNVARGNSDSVRTVLDEALHDYVSDDIAAFNESDASMESAEFAAFEGTFELPWAIMPLD